MAKLSRKKQKKNSFYERKSLVELFSDDETANNEEN
jgi:hypothetical protein